MVALFLLLALATSAVFLTGMQRVVQAGWQGYGQPLLRDYAERLAAEIGSPPDPARAQAIVARLPLAIRIDGPAVRFDSHPERFDDRDDEGDDHHDDRDHGPRGFGDDARWGFERITADGHRIRFALADPAPALRPRRVGWATLALLLGLTALAFWFVRRTLAPLDEIGRGAERFGRGEFGAPIPVRRPDELGDLAGRINRMAESLHGMLDAKRALLLAISHELRSPLTRARLNAELLDDTPERSALLRDLAVMRDLITDLLESERLAAGHAALHAEAVDVAALVRELVAADFADRGLTLALAPDLGAWPLDAARMRLLLRNLVANALRHGGDAPRPPEVFAHRSTDGGDRLELGVRDFGPGVDPQQLPRLTEAFYRPDSARTRAAGGVGLGLTLCRLVAEAHGGTLALRNAEPGLEARVSLPPAPVLPSRPASRPPGRPTAA